MMPKIDQGCFADFAPAVIDPESALPTGVTGPNGKVAVKRFNVYRNNVTVSLVNALADIFPAVQRIVGEEFFRAMARVHVRETPPQSPLLFQYGHDFADFIERFEHAQAMPWLADVARIERAWLDAYHAADVPPLAPEHLAAIPPEQLAQTRFVPHPACRIVRSRFPAVTIFSMNRQDGQARPIETREPEDALVTRPHLDVAARTLPAGGAPFLQALIDGQTLSEAAAAALAENEAFDLPANIAGMLEAGVLSSIRHSSDDLNSSQGVPG